MTAFPGINRLKGTFDQHRPLAPVIVAILDAADQELALLDLQKRGLMQRLLTGKIRVSV